MSSTEDVAIIGAGPAGLSAGYEISASSQYGVTIYEKGDQVGGISRTEIRDGYYFDIGGHRFFSKNERVNELWREVLGSDFIRVKRLSRIYYNEKFFPYPLKFLPTVTGLGVKESFGVCASYLKAAVSPIPDEKTFEDWVINRFGRKLYHLFFKSYTEKVWGIPCDCIQSDWAAERIQGLSFTTAVINALFGKNGSSKSLIEEFEYPTYGPGMMWDGFKEKIAANSGKLLLNANVIGMQHTKRKITGICWQDKNGVKSTTPTNNVISSIPLKHLIATLDPQPPARITAAANRLVYRAFIIVVLIIDKKDVFPDQWLYIHSPDVAVGRIQNFKNWSEKMVPSTVTTSLGMEYFCDKNDRLWNLSNNDIIDLAQSELKRLGIAIQATVLASYVVRQEKAYPVYNEHFKKSVAEIKDYLHSFENLQIVGRNGTHCYNNMDHSVVSGIKAAKRITGEASHAWDLPDNEYLESSGTKQTQSQ